MKTLALNWLSIGLIIPENNTNITSEDGRCAIHLVHEWTRLPRLSLKLVFLTPNRVADVAALKEGPSAPAKLVVNGVVMILVAPRLVIVDVVAQAGAVIQINIAIEVVLEEAAGMMLVGTGGQTSGQLS